MSKILVTGGLGFIGHNVVRVLESFRHECAIIDNKTTYGVIPQMELDLLMLERLCRIKTRDITYASIEDEFDDSIFEGVDVVIHLASFPRQKVVNSNPQWGSRVMSEGLLNLLELSVKHRVKKFVYISSSMVYGNFGKHEMFDGIDEASDCRPMGQYGIMKLAGEWLVEDYSRRHDIDYTIIRPSAVYGPYDVEDRVVSKFLLAAMRGEDISVNGIDDALDFTYVDDVAMGISLAAISEDTKNATYNITRGQSRTLLDAAKLAVNIVGKGTILVKPRDNSFPQRGQLNILRAKSDFGYYPEVNIEEGFQEYYDWLKDSVYWIKKAI
jgi:nucleoside-diphosphate-sugar epimerase